MSVRFDHVSKTYQEGAQQHPVLTDISLEFVSGKFTLLLGQSGSGKSTLLNLINGIDTPDQGHIWVDDTDITTLGEPGLTLFRRSQIGMVFQFFNLIPGLTVLENVTLPLELAGHHRHCRPAALELLEAVGLHTRAQARPDQLSGGEQQRVAIARALIHRPPLLLADEPTGNLDEETGEQVLALLLQLSRQAGKTLLMVSHNQELRHRADQTYRLNQHTLALVT